MFFIIRLITPTDAQKAAQSQVKRLDVERQENIKRQEEINSEHRIEKQKEEVRQSEEFRLITEDKTHRENKLSEFCNKSESLVTEIGEIKELNSMVDNFLERIPMNYVMDVNFIHFIDSSLDLELKNEMFDENKHFETWAHPLHIKAKDFYENEFTMFATIIKNKYNIENLLLAKFATNKLLKNNMQSFFALTWERKHKDFFESFDTSKILGIENVVSHYCKIIDIEPKSMVNIGLFTYFIMDKCKINYGDENQEDAFYEYEFLFNYNKNLIEAELESLKLLNFEKKLLNKREEVEYTINDVDLMGGLEFEEFVALMFSKMGYLTRVTKASGDQGIDVIAENNEMKIGIQAKCYSGQVTNTAIQEVVAGINHYNLDKAMVITNSCFSQSAIELAKSNNVILWDRNKMKEKLEEIDFNDMCI
jgi:HJR/Mrr/RecB family endonuclease